MSYRKIYEKNCGSIPEGYEIHHIDGNRSNNHINNLKCVSIEEHYNIHFLQKDYDACSAIAIRMNIPKDVLFELISKAQKKRFSNQEERNKSRLRTLEQFSDPEKRKRHKEKCISHSDKIWINNGIKNKRIYESDFVNFQNWKKGRLIPSDQIKKMINNRTNTRDIITGKFVKKR